MTALTYHVLEEAIAQCAAFHEAGVLIGVAVNASPSVITEELPGRIGRTLQRHQLEPQWLTIEITQTVDFPHIGRGSAVLSMLRSGGVHLSLDDFGTGYASLSYLQTLPIDEIKIDRSFVTHACTSARDTEILRFSAQLSRALNLRIVAEGVEDESTLSLLRELRIETAQGYYFSPPLRATDLVAQFHEISMNARRRAVSAPIDLREATRDAEPSSGRSNPAFRTGRT